MGLKPPKSSRPPILPSARRGKTARLVDSAEGRSRKTWLRIESLEDRTLLSVIGPIDGTPTPIPIGHVQPGQTIVLTVDFTTTDHNDPLEGEPLIIRDSHGATIARVTNYGTQDIQVLITEENEALTAVIQGGDGDEQATIQVGPTVEIARAYTSDSKGLTVDYFVQNNDDKTSFPLDVYRSDKDSVGSDKQVPIVQAMIKGDDATNGVHTIDISPQGTARGQYAFLQAQALRPNPSHPYVVVALDGTGELDPYDKSNSAAQTSFRIWLIGAVTHGLDGGNDLAVLFPSLVDAPYLDWVDTMAAQLVTIDHYDADVPFHWEQDSIQEKPDEAVKAGSNLATQVQQKASSLSLGMNDVVDVNFIGYSRGAVVVSQALQKLSTSSSVTALNHGFMMETLVDPHPANKPPNGLIQQYSEYQPNQSRLLSNPDQEFGLEQTADHGAGLCRKLD